MIEIKIKTRKTQAIEKNNNNASIYLEKLEKEFIKFDKSLLDGEI